MLVQACEKKEEENVLPKKKKKKKIHVKALNNSVINTQDVYNGENRIFKAFSYIYIYKYIKP